MPKNWDYTEYAFKKLEAMVGRAKDEYKGLEKTLGESHSDTHRSRLRFRSWMMVLHRVRTYTDFRYRKGDRVAVEDEHYCRMWNNGEPVYGTVIYVQADLDTYWAPYRVQFDRTTEGQPPTDYFESKDLRLLENQK